VDQELEEIDAAQHDVGGEQVVDAEVDGVSVDVGGFDGDVVGDEGTGAGQQQDDLQRHYDELVPGFAFVVLLLLDPLDDGQLLQHDAHHRQHCEQARDEVELGRGEGVGVEESDQDGHHCRHREDHHHEFEGLRRCKNTNVLR
jgi:hypothetical protein